MVNFGNIDEVSYAKKPVSKKKRKEKNLMRSYLLCNLNRNSSCEINLMLSKKTIFLLQNLRFIIQNNFNDKKLFDI